MHSSNLRVPQVLIVRVVHDETWPVNGNLLGPSLIAFFLVTIIRVPAARLVDWHGHQILPRYETVRIFIVLLLGQSRACISVIVSVVLNQLLALQGRLLHQYVIWLLLLLL